MTDNFMFTLFIGLPLIFFAVATFALSIQNRFKVQEVHALVNSRLTEVQADLAIALNRVKKLEAQIVEITRKQDDNG